MVSGLNWPYGVAVDGSGNLYIADNGSNSIDEWNAVSHVVSSLVSAGLSHPQGVAVDSAGNVYFADTNHSAIKEWPVAAPHSVVKPLVSSNLNNPGGVAVDASGNALVSGRGYQQQRSQGVELDVACGHDLVSQG